MSDRSDQTHVRVRQYRPASFADFMDEVYLTMPEHVKDVLPVETGEYVNAIVSYALDHLDHYARSLVAMVAGVYEESPRGERFVLDARSLGLGSPIVTHILYLDADGELVRVRNPELKWVPGPDGRDVLEMERYQSYEVLTGSRRGQRFSAHSRPLPEAPQVPGSPRRLRSDPDRGAGPSTDADRGPVMKVFLCHASEDKPAVRNLHRELQVLGYDPWLDEVEILPGQDWDHQIHQAVRSADVVLVCLSTRSEKRGYVQREITLVLDLADEQPPGSIYLIPTKLEECTVPERLSKYQWVNLFEPDGYGRLERALQSASRALTRR